MLTTNLKRWTVGLFVAGASMTMGDAALAGFGSHGSSGGSSGGSYGSHGSSGGSHGSSGGSWGSSGGSHGSSGGGLFARLRARKQARSHHSSGGSHGSHGSNGGSHGSHGSSGGSWGSHGSSGGSSGGTYVVPDAEMPMDAPMDAPKDAPMDEEKADGTAAPTGDSQTSIGTSSTLTVNVPAETKIFVNGKATTTPGESRTFASRNLTPGYNYTYRIRAELPRGDKTITREQVVNIRAGENGNIAFDFDADATAHTAATTR